MELPKTRKEALLNTELCYDNAKLCKKCRDNSIRYTKSGNCVACAHAHSREQKQNNKEHFKKYNRQYHLDNIEYFRTKDRQRIHIKKRQFRERSPKWADKNLIKEFYILANYFSYIFDTEFHVDHIIPLNGQYVNGLHVETNLQILPKTDNLKKSNKYGEQLWGL